jgi:hypothetical protein
MTIISGEKEKGSFPSSLFNSRIYLLHAVEKEWVKIHFRGSTFSLHSISLSSFTEKKYG